MSIRVRRVYDPPEDGDGVRVLVDRLWPRGLRKEDAAIDEWPKALTPSTELRRWYHGPHAAHEEFVRRYEAELAAPEAAREADRLRALARSRRLTLLTAVKDPEHSHAAVLAERLT
ncbi:DUF488 domain-containing protein [Kitasatospora cinereorecta]|uniref:DUF488 domain-containing protein n=1 Tax=Kitasatospora cinereorecta TaxID=285560 RepID=A0ABW0VBU4_9ACTN